MPPSPGPQARLRVEGLRPWPPLCELRKRFKARIWSGDTKGINAGCGLIERFPLPQAQANTAEISRSQETSLDVVTLGKRQVKYKKKKSGSSPHVIWVCSIETSLDVVAPGKAGKK